MRYREFVISSCFLALAVSMCTAVGLVALMTARPAMTIDPAKLAAIELGMTQEDVEGIMGGPPGDYTGGRFGVLRFT